MPSGSSSPERGAEAGDIGDYERAVGSRFARFACGGRGRDDREYLRRLGRRPSSQRRDETGEIEASPGDLDDDHLRGHLACREERIVWVREQMDREALRFRGTNMRPLRPLEQEDMPLDAGELLRDGRVACATLRAPVLGPLERDLEVLARSGPQANERARRVPLAVLHDPSDDRRVVNRAVPREASLSDLQRRVQMPATAEERAPRREAESSAGSPGVLCVHARDPYAAIETTKRRRTVQPESESRSSATGAV